MNPLTALSSLESKVAAPAVVTTVVSALVVALYQVADEFGLDLTEGQVKVLTALGVALLPVLNLVVGYLAPHTHRPDLADPGLAYDPDLEAPA